MVYLITLSPFRKANTQKIYGNTAQMNWCDGECIFCQMRSQESKVYYPMTYIDGMMNLLGRKTRQ